MLTVFLSNQEISLVIPSSDFVTFENNNQLHKLILLTRRKSKLDKKTVLLILTATDPKKFSYIVVRSTTTGYLETPGDNFSYFSITFMIYEKDIPQIFSFLAEFLSILSPQQQKETL